MQSFSTIIVSGITWGLTSLLKKQVVTENANARKNIVRLISVILAIAASFTMAAIGEGEFDVALVPLGVDAFVAVLAANGIHFLGSKK